MAFNLLRAPALFSPGFNDLTFRVQDTTNTNQPNYTVTTLRRIREAQPDAELFLIVGADEARIFAKWREPDAILNMATLVVADRPADD